METKQIVWEKTRRVVDSEGTTNTYTGKGTDLTIESRKRRIPHAGGRSGTWNHTSFFVLRNGEELAEKYSLKDAKEFAETVRESNEAGSKTDRQV